MLAARRIAAACATKFVVIDRQPFTNFLNTFDHDSLARVQSILDHPEMPRSVRPTRTGWNVDLVVGVHDRDLIVSLQFRNGALWDQQRATLHIELYPDARELPGTKRVAGIWKKRLQSQSAQSSAPIWRSAA